MEMQFYKPNGEPITKEEFIEYYSAMYYVDKSRDVEDRIDKIFKTGMSKEEAERKNELILIVAWKVGAIDYKATRKQFCKNKGTFYENVVCRSGKNRVTIEKLAEEMENGATYINNAYGKQIINLNNLIEKVSSCCKDIKTDDEAWNAISVLCECKGIGPVYAATLIYFLSHGKYPIYDQFAYKAISAIGSKDTVVGKTVINSPADLSRQRFFDYRNIIFEGFTEEKYRESRDIDKALWAYGKVF